MGTTGEHPAVKPEAAAAAGADFPRTFGNYLLLSRLARGGMGEVFLAKHGGIAGIEKHCVVKTLRPHYTDDREYTARFIDEARVVVQLSHRNIAQVFDVGRVGGQYYLAMEFIQGRDVRSLHDALDDAGTPMTEGVGLHIACEVLEALDYAHRHQDPATGRPLNLVHRDVSPQNVMVNFEGEVKLIDFGLAASEMKAEHTQPNIVMGKLAYMAPEQARGDPVDGRADLFAAAVMTYEMVTGSRYYEGMNAHDMWTISGSGGHIPSRWAEIAPPLQDILQRGLHPDRERRYTTCAEFREALEGYRFAQGYRERAANIRTIVSEVWPDAANQSRDLLSRFSNVKIMRHDDERAEHSQSFALSKGFDADVLMMPRTDAGREDTNPEVKAPATEVGEQFEQTVVVEPSTGALNVQTFDAAKTTVDDIDESFARPNRGLMLLVFLFALFAGAGGVLAWQLGLFNGEEQPVITMQPVQPIDDPVPPTPIDDPVVDEPAPTTEPVVEDPVVEEPVVEEPVVATPEPAVEPKVEPAKTEPVRSKRRRKTRRKRARKVSTPTPTPTPVVVKTPEAKPKPKPKPEPKVEKTPKQKVAELAAKARRICPTVLHSAVRTASKKSYRKAVLDLNKLIKKCGG